jgi:hypothetical protein
MITFLPILTSLPMIAFEPVITSLPVITREKEKMLGYFNGEKLRKALRGAFVNNERGEKSSFEYI